MKPCTPWPTMSTSVRIGSESTSPGAGNSAKAPGFTGVLSVMTATSCVSNPWSPGPQPGHHAGSLCTVPVTTANGGCEAYETRAGRLGSKQCAAVRNFVDDSAAPEQTKNPPPG